MYNPPLIQVSFLFVGDSKTEPCILMFVPGVAFVYAGCFVTISCSVKVVEYVFIFFQNFFSVNLIFFAFEFLVYLMVSLVHTFTI